MTNANHDEIKFEKMATADLQQTISTPDIWQTRIRLFARGTKTGGGVGSVDISSLAQSITWQDQSTDDLANINTQAAMTGSLVMTKPNLRDYKKLGGLVFPGPGESFTARMNSLGVGEGSAPPGAVGSVIICQVGYGNSYTNIWAMRVVPGYDSGVSETVTLSDGSWTLNLADDLWAMAQTVADFKYTKGKVTRKNGWRCDQIALDLCQQYKIPVRTLCKGTAYFELAASDTQLTSPADVLTKAYAEETKRTGRTFIIRWGPPGQAFPLGALEVIPMRRNRVLYKFRDQLMEATLTRDMDPTFATVVEARGQLQSGKTTKKITFTAKNGGAINRFGFIRKTVNFGKVSSHLELQILAKRSLAQRLTPIRTAEINHPGFPTVRRGDAIHLNIPEEGYQETKLLAYSTIAEKGKSKMYVAALRDAEKLDPTMFDKPDAALAASQASQDTSTTTQAADANTPAFLPVANQGLAFVTSAVHTASAGSYTMDLSLGFQDVLDPNEVRAQVDKAVRAYKSSNKGS